MTEKQAQDKGLMHIRFVATLLGKPLTAFTEEELLETLASTKELRGYAYQVVTVDQPEFSRASPFRVYIDPVYFTDANIKALEDRLAEVQERIQEEATKYMQSVKEILDQKESWEARLKELKSKREGLVL